MPKVSSYPNQPFHSAAAASSVECFAAFCPYFHVSVPVQKLTHDGTICAFIRAILLNLSLRLCDSPLLYRDLELKSLDLCHVNDYSNAN